MFGAHNLARKTPQHRSKLHSCDLHTKAPLVFIRGHHVLQGVTKAATCAAFPPRPRHAQGCQSS